MIIFLAWLLTSTAFADKVVGKITYPKSEPSPLFFYENTRKKEGNKIISKTKYTDRSGKAVVEEEAVYEGNSVLKYTYKQNQVNEYGFIEAKNGKMIFSFNKGEKNETDEEDIVPKMIVADLLNDYFRQNWDDLMKEETIKVRFLFVERTETIGFKFFTIGEREIRGIPVVDIKMKPSSFIIAALTDPLIFTVEKNPPHRILETFGRLPVRVSDKPDSKDRSDWHAIDAKMELEYKK